MEMYSDNYREVGLGCEYLEGIPAEKGLWFESEVDRARREALRAFFDSVKPAVLEMVDGTLTPRQREVVKLYYLCEKSQEDIATILDLSQSTVSRHLFGTVRAGRKVGGAIPKLRKAMERAKPAVVDAALDELQERFAETA